MRAPAVVLLLTVVAVPLAGCGSSSGDSSTDFKGAQKQVAATVEDLQDAGKRRDEGKICNELLSKALLARIKAAGGGRKDCEKQVKDSLRDADSFELDVKKVVVAGRTATATVVSKPGGDNKDRTDVLTLVLEDGRWRISALGS